MAVYNGFLLIVSIAVAIPSALAQQTGNLGPADPAAAEPAAMYESAFGGYIPHSEPKISPWRDINDEAARIGGHAGVLRQYGMRGAQPRAVSASPSSAPSPAMPGHGASHK